MEWRPIATAPKDQRVLLCFEEQLFTNVYSVCGKWDSDKYSKKPQPHWTNDLKNLLGVPRTRIQQPAWWAPLSNPPLNF